MLQRSGRDNNDIDNVFCRYHHQPLPSRDPIDSASAPFGPLPELDQGQGSAHHRLVGWSMRSRRTFGVAFVEWVVYLDVEIQSVSAINVTTELTQQEAEDLNEHSEYPHFYRRLYGFMDREVLHVRHRARFFRLTETFLRSP